MNEMIFIFIQKQKIQITHTQFITSGKLLNQQTMDSRHWINDHLELVL